MARKRKDIFKNLVGLQGGNKKWRLGDGGTKDNEKWIYHIMSADREAPKIESDRNIKPFIIMGVTCMLFFSLIIGKISYLQITRGGENRTLAESNRSRGNIIRAPRGIIYDKKHIKLVKNTPSYEVAVVPIDLPKDTNDKNNVFKSLSLLLNIPETEIRQKIDEKGDNYTQPILLKENISKDDSFIISSKTLKGVNVSVNPIREYLDGGELSHALGYVGRISEDELNTRQNEYMLTDYIGKSGLEKSYEEILRGEDGSQRYEVDSTGKVVKFLGSSEPKLGNSVVLSLDFELQKKLSDTIKKVMSKNTGLKATAVAQDPRTGEILAYVNIPSYDNNLFSKGISGNDYSRLLDDKSNPLLARAIQGEYPSGSSIKPFVAAGALQEGNINESSSVNSTGGISIGEWKFPDWKPGGHGMTNVTKAIAESVNTFFYAIGGGHDNIKGLGPEKMKHYLELFGFGKNTEIDVGGEMRGSIPDPAWKEKTKNEDWYLGDTYHMAIGQGDILVTPLQIANATSSIANGGTLYKPKFVCEIVDENDKVLETKKPELLNKDFISAKNLEIVKRGMRQTVTAGSARSLNDLPVAVSGKTGTAQFGPDEKKYHGWFTSFAPYDNPEITLTVLVEGSGGGDVTAVPIAKEVYKWYFGGRK